MIEKLTPFLIGVSLVIGFYSSWLWSFVAMAVCFYLLPGRGWRAKIDRYAQQDGAFLAGMRMVPPSRRFYIRQWGLVLMLLLYGLFWIWGTSQTLMVQQMGPEDDSPDTLRQIVASIIEENPSLSLDGDAQSAKVEAFGVENAGSAEVLKKGLTGEMSSEGKGYDWAHQRPFRLE